MGQSPARMTVECLRRHGVETIFGLDGDHVISLYDALADAPDIRVITVMHENNAAIAAELYARASGRPGVVLLTVGHDLERVLRDGGPFDAPARRCHLLLFHGPGGEVVGGEVARVVWEVLRLSLIHI